MAREALEGESEEALGFFSKVVLSSQRLDRVIGSVVFHHQSFQTCMSVPHILMESLQLS
jgi:hypothetical protein